jgi:hypothetical protein
MQLALTSPRSRGGHLAAFPAPDNCGATHLLLSESDGTRLIAERDPSLPIYQVNLPTMAAGEEKIFAVTSIKHAGVASEIEYLQGGERVEISLSGSPFMTFHHGAGYPKPVINPVLTPGGTNMLREPMAVYAEGEHPWQRGITLMQGAINGIDCWNEKKGEGFGRTEQDGIVVSHRPLSLTLATENSWYAGDVPLMTDSRTYRLFDTPRDQAILDIQLTLKASYGPVTIGATKEGGFLCIRVTPTMNANEGGNMRNVYGATDENGCWSKPAHWVDYSGPVGNEMAGFAIFDHPQNFRYPTTWHVRDYGLFAPNCWMFNPDHLLAQGDSMTFRWRVIVHVGDTEQAAISSQFLDYVDGPRAKWE